MFDNGVAHISWVRRSALFFAALALACVAQAIAARSAAAATYYISPNGNDGNNGTSAGTAWKTFTHAWAILQSGDTLLLLDGTYTDSTTGLVQPNIRNGEPGRPITIKALTDGKAVIDGEGKSIPVRLGENWGPSGAIGDWYVVEGLVARNGSESTIAVLRGNHNVLRRVSAYNANVDDNSLVILLAWASDNLVEDCVAAGTGRYMIDIFSSSNNTVRRCFTQWQRWDGRAFCGVTWPNGNNVGVYNSSNTTVENVIAYGRALTGIFIQANDDSVAANNNQILGSMALLQGRDYDGSRWQYGTGVDQPTSRPGPTVNKYGPTCDEYITQWTWGNYRQGFTLWGQGELHDNVFRDILATGNMGLGWSAAHPGGPASVRTIVDHATLTGNGAEIEPWEAGQGGNISISRGDVTVTNSRIANSQWSDQGEGARFKYRYVDRQLTDQPLWPWPMEERIRNELGVSVNGIATKYANIDSFSLTVGPVTRELERKGVAEVKVTVDTLGMFTKPVTLHADVSDSGLSLDSSDATVNVPGEWTFTITAPDESRVYVITISATADGYSEVQRKIVILVDPKKFFLPAVSAGIK